MSKIRLATIGACCSRDFCNSNFVPNWRERFDQIYYSFQTSFVSIASRPIEYDIKSIRKKTDEYTEFYKNVLLREFSKSYINDLLSLKPDNLLIDFYGDVIKGVRKLEGNTFVTQRKFRQDNNAAFAELECLGDYKILRCEDEYFDLWKKSIDFFLYFMWRYLPKTNIILNVPHFTNRVRFEDGHIELLKDPVEKYNEYYNKMTQYVVQNYPFVKILDLNKSYDSDPNYIFGGAGIVHFHREYYLDMANELEKLSIKSSDNNLCSNFNLLINNDLRHGKSFYKKWSNKMKIEQGIDNVKIIHYCEKNEKELKHAGVWSCDIPLDGKGNEPYTICFDCKVGKKIEISNPIIFYIRTFDKEDQKYKLECVEQYKFVFDEKVFDDYVHYSMTVRPLGKFMSIGLYCAQNGDVSWKNIEVFHAESEPIEKRGNIISLLLENSEGDLNWINSDDRRI